MNPLSLLFSLGGGFVVLIVVLLIVLVVMHKTHSTALAALVGKVETLSAELKSQLGVVKAQVKETQSKVSDAVSAAADDIKVHTGALSAESQAGIDKLATDIKDTVTAAAETELKDTFGNS